MKRIIITLAVVLASVLVAAARRVEPEQRVVKSFTKIENTTSVDIHYTQSNRYEVKVVGLAADRERLQTETVDGVLTLTLAPGQKGGFRGVPTVEVSCPRLDRYEGLGSGRFLAEAPLADVWRLTVHLVGSGSARLSDVHSKTLELVNEGSGHITVVSADVSGRLTLRNEGSGRIECSGHAGETRAENRGSGSVTGHLTTTSVSGTNQGSGKIQLEGTADTADLQQMGSGKAEFRQRPGRI